MSRWITSSRGLRKGEIVHDYLGSNLERIWDVVTIHLRALKPHIARIAADLAV